MHSNTYAYRYMLWLNSVKIQQIRQYNCVIVLVIIIIWTDTLNPKHELLQTKGHHNGYILLH